MTQPKQHASVVDLTTINQLAEIILRAGDLTTNQARRILQSAYTEDEDYDNVFGISVLFRAGASAADLAQEGGGFKHAKLGITFVQKLIEELAGIGCTPCLFITPMLQFQLPDHHTLAIAHNGITVPALSDEAADALIRSFLIVNNPYRRK